MKKQLLLISFIVVGSSAYAAERARGAGAGKIPVRAVNKLAERAGVEDEMNTVVEMCPTCGRGISAAQTATAETLLCGHMYHIDCAQTAKAIHCFACQKQKPEESKRSAQPKAAPAKKAEAPKKAAPKKEAKKETKDCSICMDTLKNPMALTCGDTFCTACIDSWFVSSGKRECPVCKTPVGATKVVAADAAERPGARPVAAPVRNARIEDLELAAVLRLSELTLEPGTVVIYGAGAGAGVARNCALCESPIARGQEQQRAGKSYHALCKELLS